MHLKVVAKTATADLGLISVAKSCGTALGDESKENYLYFVLT